LEQPPSLSKREAELSFQSKETAKPDATERLKTPGEESLKGFLFSTCALLTLKAIQVLGASAW
jgi:hypothetical protein